MTVATYQKLAGVVIDDILERGKVPIICGGTGLYLSSILYQMDFAGGKGTSARRAQLESMAERNGSEYMHQFLQALDPEAAERIHPNNARKIIRAIEAFEEGERIGSMSDLKLNPKYDFSSSMSLLLSVIFCGFKVNVSLSACQHVKVRFAQLLLGVVACEPELLVSAGRDAVHHVDHDGLED